MIDMRWNKFAEFTANNLSLAKCLDELIGPGILSSDFPTMRSWVESQVDFVCVRPWHTLSMDSVNQDGRSNPSTEHIVFHHIEGEGQPFGRARYTRWDSSIGSRSSVGDTIAGLVAWHSEYWAKQEDRPLVFDAVVRKRIRIEPEDEYRHEALEFFIFPQGFQP